MRSGSIQKVDGYLEMSGGYGYGWSDTAYDVVHAWRIAVLLILEDSLITGADSRSAHAFPGDRW